MIDKIAARTVHSVRRYTDAECCRERLTAQDHGHGVAICYWLNGLDPRYEDQEDNGPRELEGSEDDDCFCDARHDMIVRNLNMKMVEGKLMI